MAHVVTSPREAFLACDGRLRVHQIPAAHDNLIWLAECVETGAVAIVDGPGTQELDTYCAAHNLTPSMVLNTHTHPDHVGVNRGLIGSGRGDQIQFIGPAGAAADVPGLDRAVDEGDVVKVGAVEGRVMRTDGHLNGHICYVFGDVLFCGDTLFAGGCGFLFDGPAATMFDSLMRLAALPGHTLVCCAHEYTQDNLRFAWSVEPENAALAQRIRDDWHTRSTGGCTLPSTMDTERATNPFLRPGSPSLMTAVAKAMDAADLSSHSNVFAATRALKNTGAYKSVPDSNLPLEAS